MKIVDDVMPAVLQNDIEEFALSVHCRWSFLEDSTYANNIKNVDYPVPSFAYSCMMDRKVIDEAMFSLLRPCILCISDVFDLDLSSLFRVRLGLHIPTNAPEHNQPHNDYRDRHNVVLYYLNDSDGDTFFFDKEMEITERVTPKKGRAVMFDGKIKHASSVPSKGPRIVLNLNYLK